MVTSIIRSELLEASVHPRAIITASLRAGSDATSRVVEGSLLLHGVRRGLRFTGTLRRRGDGYRLSGSFDMSRSAFGMRRVRDLDWMIDDVFHVELDLLARPEKVTIEVGPAPR
jgi:polyisoprenoid-binding protein YceI